MRRKVILLSICAILLSVTTVTGALALMFDQESKVNTLTVGSVRIDLQETPTDDGDDDPTTNTYHMLTAGEVITKDPLITVAPGSVDCWLFVQLEKSENFDDYLSYELASGWTELVNYPGVYFRTVAADAADREFHVFADDAVQVHSTLTEEELSAVEEEDAPTLKVTAYAVQQAGVDNHQEAWMQLLAQTGSSEA